MQLRVTKVFPEIARRVFGTHSSFRVGWRTARGGSFLFFKGFQLVLAGLLFRRGHWGLGYYFMKFRHFYETF